MKLELTIFVDDDTSFKGLYFVTHCRIDLKMSYVLNNDK